MLLSPDIVPLVIYIYICQFEFLLLRSYPLMLMQVLTEYILVSMTSAVSVTIAGVVKEAVTILV